MGWTSAGVDHDTAAFAVNTTLHSWRRMGKKLYPPAHSQMIAADGDGGNGARVRLWKCELQCFADGFGPVVHASHLLPGTSKWNRIEHRLFSFISRNRRGQPLLTRATLVNLFAAVTTGTGRKARSEMDRGRSPRSIPGTEEQMGRVRKTPADFNGA